MEPYERVVNACELQSNILGELLPNLQPQVQPWHPRPTVPPLPKKTGGYQRKENDTRNYGTSFAPRGRGRGRGRRSYSEKGNQVNPNAFEDEPRSEPKIEDRKVNDQDVKPIEKKLEEIKISEKETKANPKPYNLRGSTSGGSKHDVDANVPEKETVPADNESEEETFKKPDLANLTIAQLIPSAGKSTLPVPNIGQCVANIIPSETDSPVRSGSLKKKAIDDSMPCSPPSVASTHSDMSAKLREVSDTARDADCSSSILKPNGSSVEKLDRYEDTWNAISSKPIRPFAGTQEEYKSSDPQFLPISLAMGHSSQEYLFVTSQINNQVQVFLDGKQQGVLKLNDSKYFTSVRNVHTIADSDNISQVVVLDNGGFHFFAENGLYIRTVLSGAGFKYRGLGHIHYEGNLCLISLDVNERSNGGTEVVIINVEAKSQQCNSIVKRMRIAGTDNIPDAKSKCRFLTVTPDEKKVYVTSLQLNQIFSVDLLNGESKTFDHGINEPAGIAIHPKNGIIFVASRSDGNIEIFNSAMGYLGRFLTLEAMPVGLCVHKENLYVATNATNMMNTTMVNDLITHWRAIIKVPIKYN